MKHQPRIAVIGSANIDLVTYTDQFPRPGETIFGREFSLGFGGKGANQAVAARLCGAVIGSANIDLVTYTDQFPRPGETIFGREFSLGFGGTGKLVRVGD